MKKKYAIGADIGGSHISAVIMDLEEKKILTNSFATCKVDNKAKAEVILDSWKTALMKTIPDVNEEQIAGIGFAMPGPFDYEKGIAMFTHEVAKYENLHGLYVGEKLRSLLGLNESVLFRFMNDATSFAVGESWIGKSANSERSVAITLGTGFGSAFIESGIPVLDREDVPKMGCVWHLPFKKGIADDYFSTRWFIYNYQERTGRFLPGVREIAELASSDSIAAQLFQEFGTSLGEFLGTWLRKFNADCLVIGGNLTGAYHLFGPYLEEALKQQHINIPVHLSELKETAAMIGSARLMEEDFWEKVKPLLSKM
ncbi:MAG TPA: ROK family protein [Bacteroidales bacterium]